MIPCRRGSTGWRGLAIAGTPSGRGPKRWRGGWRWRGAAGSGWRARFAGGLSDPGVGQGDRVLIYMPMVPEAVIAMLACARLGAIHSVVFGGFAPAELSARIEDAEPKVIVSASCEIEPTRTIAYKPFLDGAIERSSHKPERCVILQRPQLAAELGERDIEWQQVMAEAEPVGCVDVDATDPLYILYTSGTTGRPKGIVRDNGGHAVALAWSMANIYDMASSRGRCNTGLLKGS